MAENQLSIALMGDIVCNRENPETLLAHVAPALRGFDIRFCQLEFPMTDRGELTVWARSLASGHLRHPSHNIRAYSSVGIDVASFASNHTMDFGDEGLFDTMESCREHGIQIIGVGKDIEEARRPAIIEKKGVTVAFLAYCSVPPPGTWAGKGIPGCTPLRAHTYFEPTEYQPGTPARVVTYAHRGDLAALCEDVKRAKSRADIVLVSMHWGIHFVRAEIAMYEHEAARAAIDAGADLVFGHHPHILKGCQVYKGKLILHSLGNFAFDFRVKDSPRIRELKRALGWDPVKLQEERGYIFPEESRKSMIVKVVVSGKRVERASFLPVMINRNAEPELLRPSDPAFDAVVRYMREITEEAGLNAQYAVEGEEVVISA